MTATWDARARTRLGIGLFLGADSVLFLMLFIAFVTFHDAGALRNLNLTLGSVLTVSILSAAASLGWAARGNGKVGVVSLLPAIVFAGIQIADFRRLIAHNMTTATSPFDTAYFTLTGIHLINVAVGLIALGLFVVFESRTGFQGERREAALSALSLYWYFLVAVWVLIFVIAYLGGVL